MQTLRSAAWSTSGCGGTFVSLPASVREVGRLAGVVPLLVEYSENDDTGCGFGLILLTCVTVGIVLLVRVTLQLQRRSVS